MKPVVIVTGGTGLIGRSTLPLLLDRGVELHVLTTRPDAARVPPGVRVHGADLLSPEGASAAIAEAQPTHLLHLAWFYQPGAVYSSLENLRWVEASLALFRSFAASGGTRAVFAGTGAEYAPSAAPCREYETLLAPSSVYGASKQGLGSIVAAAAREAGVALTWGRIFNTYGPGEHPERLIAYVTRQLLGGLPAACSHGRQVRDYLFAPDVASALVELLLSDLSGPVNVASGREQSLRATLATLAEIAGRPDLLELGAIATRNDEPPVVAADVRRLRDELGWRPGYSLEQGLEQTVAWWRGQPVATP